MKRAKKRTTIKESKLVSKLKEFDKKLIESSVAFMELQKNCFEEVSNSTFYKNMRLIADASAATGISIETLARQSLSTEQLEELARPQVVEVPRCFEDTMSDADIEKLLSVMNKYIFVDEQTVESVRIWLRCEQPQPVVAKNVRYLAYMLKELSEADMICNNCMQVAGERKVFASKETKNKPSKVITASNLTSSLNRLINRDNYQPEVIGAPALKRRKRIDAIKDEIEKAV